MVIVKVVREVAGISIDEALSTPSKKIEVVPEEVVKTAVQTVAALVIFI